MYTNVLKEGAKGVVDRGREGGWFHYYLEPAGMVDYLGR